VRRLGIFSFEKPIRIDRLLGGYLRIYIFEVDAFNLNSGNMGTSTPGKRDPRCAGAF
jgi:hypothetical protein